jgi:hypothetical protein
MAAAAPNAQPQTPSIEEILARVQAGTGQFEKSLPDFVCDEKISSLARYGKKMIEVTTLSHFTGVQKKSGPMNYTESRELISVDGRAAQPGQELSGPILFGGGFSSVLNETFSPRYAPIHSYRVAGERQFRGRTTLVVEFATRPGQTLLAQDIDGHRYLLNDTGVAWIDKETLRVLRLRRRYLNVPEGNSPAEATVDYSEVQIDGKPFWMPKTVRMTQGRSRTFQNGAYTAEYSNYRKFETSSAITFDK